MASSIVLCVLAILGLGGALLLFLNLKQEVRASSIRNRRKMDMLLKSMEEKLAQAPAAPARSELIYIPANPRSGLKYHQARSGDADGSAAQRGHLGTSPWRSAYRSAEVELLIRVHRMSSRSRASANPGSCGRSN